MTIPVDPGTSLLDNNNEPILLAGATGLHERFAELYAMFNGGIGPDNLMLGATYLWTGAHTFNAGNLKVKGAGVGIASLQNANTAINRTLTIPDPGVDDTLLSTKYVKVAGGGVGVATLQNATTANNRTITVPDAGADDTLLSTKQVKVAGAGSGVATIQNANTANNRTITIPDPGANDTFVTQLTLPGILPPSTNGTINLGLRAATTTNSNDSIKLTSRDGSPLSVSNVFYATLPDDVTPGQFETFSFTSDITLKISGAHWGIDTYGDLTNVILRVGLINDGSATPALVVYYLGGRTSVINTKCFSTQTSVTEPEYILSNRSILAGTWPIQEIGYFLANFTDSTNVWAVQSAEIWPGKNADGILQTWVPYFSGLTTTSATMGSCKWSQQGKTISIFFEMSFSSAPTSNTTTFAVTNVPIKSSRTYFSPARTYDNSTIQAAPGAVATQVGTRTFQFYKTWDTSASWTNVNDKAINFVCHFEAQY